MMKFTCLALLALATMTVAQDAAPKPPPLDIIPFAATFIKRGCDQICSTLSALCQLGTPPEQCSGLLKDCPTLCTNLETCINGCGPNCDKFETHCVESGIIYAPVAGIFCPVLGQSCDVACVVACPQNMLLNVITQVVSQLGLQVQTFIAQLIPKSE